MAEATELTGLAPKETHPVTEFGTALTGFADQIDVLAGKETNFTHRQMWLALGSEAVVGAAAIAAVGAFHIGGNVINPEDILAPLMEKMKYTGTVTDGTTEDWRYWLMAEKGEVTARHQGWKYVQNVGEFARGLITGGIKDETGKSVFLLNNETTANVINLLGQLSKLEGTRDQLRNLFLLGGVGSALIAALQAKAGEKVKFSAPIGKIPAVLPAIANVMRGVGKLF
jgi:hypothetical protein